MSFRAVEEFLPERRITVIYHRGITIHDQQHYLWRAVHQDGNTLAILMQHRRNMPSAVRVFRQLNKDQGHEPRRPATAKLRSDNVAHRIVMHAAAPI